ncbi:MAG: hypothetical protein K0R09_1488 [Clostridiales bacterium]|jgi:hypothetical protein|nr:hypothetical protein [Clostridiales bacterium]
MRKFFIYFSLAIFTIMGMYVMTTASSLPRTYDGKNTNVYELQRNPKDYSIENPDGVAEVIIKENLGRSRAVNAVTAVMFDFRGYDTLGEAFIFLTAITGVIVILRNEKKREGSPDEEKHKG